MASFISVQETRSIRFSESPEVFVTEPQGQWYTAAERLSFRIQVIRDATHVRRLMAANRDQNSDIFIEDDKYRCIGLEVFLSEAFARESMQRRQLHIHAILSEQARQRICNDVNDERLRRVSKETSFWCRKIARIRAIAYEDL